MITSPAEALMMPFGLTPWQRAMKRCFDILVAAAVLIGFGWLIPVAAFAARVSCGASGIFRQSRIGRNGRSFTILKLRTMRTGSELGTTVTANNDPRITRIGRLLRRTKLDELPQFVNVLRGDMSLVGPRPDVSGFADQLEGSARIVLSVRPGITGPATLRFRNEESLLACQPDPERHNRDVIFPEKVRLNMRYVVNWTFRSDLRYLWLTVRAASIPIDYTV